MEPWDLIMVWSKALYLLQGPNCPLRWVMYQTPEPLMTSTIEKCHDSNAGPELTSTIIKKRYMSNAGPQMTFWMLNF